MMVKVAIMTVVVVVVVPVKTVVMSVMVRMAVVVMIIMMIIVVMVMVLLNQLSPYLSGLIGNHYIQTKTSKCNLREWTTCSQPFTDYVYGAIKI